jgi:hypothetical protein
LLIDFFCFFQSFQYFKASLTIKKSYPECFSPGHRFAATRADHGRGSGWHNFIELIISPGGISSSGVAILDFFCIVKKFKFSVWVRIYWINQDSKNL